MWYSMSCSATVWLLLLLLLCLCALNRTLHLYVRVEHIDHQIKLITVLTATAKYYMTCKPSST